MAGRGCANLQILNGLNVNPKSHVYEDTNSKTSINRIKESILFHIVCHHHPPGHQNPNEMVPATISNAKRMRHEWSKTSSQNHLP